LILSLLVTTSGFTTSGMPAVPFPVTTSGRNFLSGNLILPLLITTSGYHFWWPFPVTTSGHNFRSGNLILPLLISTSGFTTSGHHCYSALSVVNTKCWLPEE
jgi:hypothetical protein